MECDDHILKLGTSSLMVIKQSRVEFILSISWNIQFNCAILSIEGGLVTSVSTVITAFGFSAVFLTIKH
jgi:hypothetical protein